MITEFMELLKDNKKWNLLKDINYLSKKFNDDEYILLSIKFDKIKGIYHLRFINFLGDKTINLNGDYTQIEYIINTSWIIERVGIYE